MQVVALFFGIIIHMDYDNTLPPHFYARYQGQDAIFDFEGNLIKGSLSVAKTKLVVAWAEIYKDDLIANYELVSNGLEPQKIASLSF